MILINIDKLTDDNLSKLVKQYIISHPRLFKEVSKTDPLYGSLKSQIVEITAFTRLTVGDYYVTLHDNDMYPDSQDIIGDLKDYSWKCPKGDRSQRHFHHTTHINIMQPTQTISKNFKASFQGRVFKGIPNYEQNHQYAYAILQLCDQEKANKGEYEYINETTVDKVRRAHVTAYSDAVSQAMSWIVYQKYNITDEMLKILLQAYPYGFDWSDDYGEIKLEVCPNSSLLIRKHEGKQPSIIEISALKLEQALISARGRMYALFYGLNRDNKNLFKYFKAFEEYVEFVRSDLHTLNWNTRALHINLLHANLAESDKLSEASALPKVRFLLDKTEYDKAHWLLLDQRKTLYNDVYKSRGFWVPLRQNIEDNAPFQGEIR